MKKIFVGIDISKGKLNLCWRANQTMKVLLHMAAVGTATHMKAGEYKEYYKRRLAEGKHVMSVLNVIRAKLVHRMFAVIRRDTEYSRQYHHAYCPL